MLPNTIARHVAAAPWWSDFKRYIGHHQGEENAALIFARCIYFGFFLTSIVSAFHHWEHQNVRSSMKSLFDGDCYTTVDAVWDGVLGMIQPAIHTKMQGVYRTGGEDGLIGTLRP